MPKSRRRKPKKTNTATRIARRQPWPGVPPGLPGLRSVPVMPAVAGREIYEPLLAVPIEVMPLHAPLAVFRQDAIGQPANSCAPVCYQFAGALRHLGFRAELVAACVSVANTQGGATKITDVGLWKRPPIVYHDGTMRGHVVVWTESFHQLVDLTVGQDETLQRASRHNPSVAAPVVLPMPTLHTFGDGPTPVVLRPPFLLTYMLFPAWTTALEPLWRDARLVARLDRAALALAHESLKVLRVVEQHVPARRVTAPQLRDLLDGRAILPPLPT